MYSRNAFIQSSIKDIDPWVQNCSLIEVSILQVFSGMIYYNEEITGK